MPPPPPADPLFSFSVVLIAPSYTDSPSVAQLADVVRRLSAALLHEEGRVGYVSSSVSDMGRRLPPPTPSSPWPELSLCLPRELAAVYDALSGGPTATLRTLQFTMNGHLGVSLWLPGGGAARLHGIVRPYHALLLLEDPATLLSRLPPDSSPQLAALIAVASPLRSFHECVGETGVNADALLRLASHLTHWGVARVLPVVTSFSMFAVAPTADCDAASPHAAAFSAQFGQPLGTVLSLFSNPPPIDVGQESVAQGLAPWQAPVGSGATVKTLVDALPAEHRDKWLAVLMFLLKAHLVEQVHMSLLLVWPRQQQLQQQQQQPLPPPQQQQQQQPAPPQQPPQLGFTLGSLAREALQQPLLTDDGEVQTTNSEFVVNENAAWSSAELAHLHRLCEGRPARLVPVFTRIVVYLREVKLAVVTAKHGADSVRLDEVMFRLSLTRKTVNEVCGCWPEVLVRTALVGVVE